MSVPKDKLHKLIDALPEAATEEAAKYLESLLEYKKVKDKSDLKKALETASYDDEPMTDEDVNDLQEAQKEIEAGETVSLDEVKRMLEL